MNKTKGFRFLLPYGLGSSLPRIGTSHLPDVLMFSAGIALFYGLLTVARTWLGPFTPTVDISLSVRALPAYAGFSLLRLGAAYVLSLAFTLVYGYVAAYNARAERFMIPLLDVLQSIPVLSFLPPVMLAMVAIFPRRQIGVELGAILLIFTGQVWNMAFSFYASLKSVPREMMEAAGIYNFSWWQRFLQLELPSAAIGLVWNSMMSVAGGWFALMACEMFVLGTRDFRLPGLGSFLQTASSAGDTRSMLLGVAVMIALIVLIDQFLWRPVIAWAEKFKVEQVESSDAPRSWVLGLLQRSTSLAYLRRKTLHPIGESIILRCAQPQGVREVKERPSPAQLWIFRSLGAAAVVVVIYAVTRTAIMAASVSRSDGAALIAGLFITFSRVAAGLLIGAAWTIPVGVMIGFHPRMARWAQPVAQIAASVPATAFFPIILLLLVRVGARFSIGSILLLLLGTQWYILFNVIAGAMAIPTDLKEACAVFGIVGWERWKKLILPGIFPYLITGLVTASGGAWNASIVAEYFHFKGQIFSTAGLGAMISKATDEGNFPLLIAATLLMAGVVATVNRLLWRRLYKLAETRFRLEC